MFPNLPSILSRTFLLALFSFLVLSAQGQSTELSPYSRYGIGEVRLSGLSNTAGMSGLADPIAYKSSVNPANPATYAQLEDPVFEFGAETRFLELSTAASTQDLRTTGLRHIVMGFPVSEHWGLTFGLLPYSSIGYNIKDEVNVSGVGTVEHFYEGTGGIRRVFLGNGVDLINQADSTILSLGVNASYLFGSLDNERNSILPDDGSFNTKVLDQRYVSDLHFEGGLYFQTYLGKEGRHKLSAGVSGTLPAALNTERSLLVTSYALTGAGTEATIDTVRFEEEKKGSLSIPYSLSGGVAWEYDEKLLVGVEGEYAPWSDYETSFGSEITSGGLSDRMKMALGLRYTPQQKMDANSTFLHLTSYRLGGYYTQTPIQVGDHRLEELGMSFGLGIPLLRSSSTSRIDIGAIFGVRGTTDDELVKERFVRLQIALSLSPHKADRWFYQRKYN